MLTTNKQRITQVYQCVKTFHNLESLPPELPDPQNLNLLPTLRPYQVRAVKWMLYKELVPSFYQSSQVNTEEAVLLPKGGILAEEMGLGKTVEVLSCILSNPRKLSGDDRTSMQSRGGNSYENVCVKEEPSSCVKLKTMDDELHPTEDGGLKVHADSNSDRDLKSELSSQNENDSKDVSSISGSQENVHLNKLDQEQVTSDRQSRKRSRTNAIGLSSSKRVKFNDETQEISGVIGGRSKVGKLKPENQLPNQTKNSKKRVGNYSKSLESQKCPMDTTIDEVILKYCHDGVAPRPKRAAAVKAGETYALLKAWYDNCLTESSAKTERTRRFQRQSDFQCCCTSEIVSENVVECPKCKTWQHSECVGYDEDFEYDYYCFRCWMDQPPVLSAGTVIISPEAISQQWLSEIDKHIKKDCNLKVLVYEGVRVNGYIQPHNLASYDIIITTYQVLTRELNYTEPVERSLRHAKRFFAPTSPLMFVQWWRLCLDEAQMVEGSTCRAGEMAKKLSAVNKWAVTGTPIQKAINDLVGLMEFLAGTDYPEFSELLSRDWRSLLMLVPRILWRSQMNDVLAETGVPPQSMNTHMLQFSKIEKYFYKCTHTECSQQFVNRITRFGNLNLPLKSLDRKAIGNLLNPLLKLRQACIHPQAVRGKFMSIKKTMTMEDLVAQMVTNAKLDAEQALRQLVATLNGTGALHIIRREWSEAVAAYRAVLHLEHEHNGRLKIDSLQRIHAMYNLAEVLDGSYDGIPPTLRDGKLRDDLKALELRYLGKRETPISVTKERVDQHAESVSSQLQGATLSYSEWWLRVMEWSSDREELLDRVKGAIQGTDVQQKNQFNNLANKLKSVLIVRAEIAQWLAELDMTRIQVCTKLKELREADSDAMAADALVCHLPQAASVRGRTRCILCQTESVLKRYEALLFEERSKEKRKNKKRNLPGSSDWKDDKDLDNKEIADLVDVNVNTFESSKKGGFKASPFEKILRALAVYGRQKQVPSNWTKEANHHFTLLDRVKKEFLDLNLLWRQIFDLVDAKDELNMCKTRLRLPYLGEEQEMEGKKKKIGETHHIIALYKVEPELLKLMAERDQYEALLTKKTGTLCYLENLQKEGAPAAICPICRNDLSDKWSVLCCGHCVCLDCLSVMSARPQTVSVLCPQCRQQCSVQDVSYVESDPSDSQPVEVQGSHSTKVNAVISQTLKLLHNHSDVKILVFSVWDKVLDLLAEAFKENNITFRQMKSGKMKQRQAIKDFKTDNVSVLLLPLRSGAKGLNLVEATHVFLVEPILNPAEELQAVGRVHRIGQTRPTMVHRFIVGETIEERILAAVAASGADQWSDDCITLQQLFDLFSSNIDLTLSMSEAGPSATVDSSDSESETEQQDAASTFLYEDSDDDDGQ